MLSEVADMADLMKLLDKLQKWILEILGTIIVLFAGIPFVKNLYLGSVENWWAYIVIIAFGALLIGFPSIWRAVKGN